MACSLEGPDYVFCIGVHLVLCHLTSGYILRNVSLDDTEFTHTPGWRRSDGRHGLFVQPRDAANTRWRRLLPFNVMCWSML
jgi:hypothetical protein